MSYLDPRAGQPSGDDTSPPASYPYGAQAEPADPYADFRPAAPAPVNGMPAWHADEPGSEAFRPVPEDVPITEQPIQRGPGRRRAGKSDKGASKGRSGRNLPAAISVGVGLVLVVLASLVVWPPAFLGVIVVASGVGVWEMTRALKKSGADAPLIPLAAGAVVMTGLAWKAGVDALILGLAVTVAAALIWRLADGVAALRRDLTASVLIAVYVPFLLGFGVLLQQPDPDFDGRWRVLCTLLAVVLSDTGGFAAGVFLGKHKMAPSISPGKTWEGFAGSISASAIGSALLLYFLLDIPSYWGLLFGAVISVVAVVGDLAESMLKRDLGVKDMSNVLPGHGGVMDRLDSILFAVPVAYLLFAVIAANQQ
ncbi:phosphatidate cytidylyltransferase [Micromonosporaceae bacterium Da 78-11]